MGSEKEIDSYACLSCGFIHDGKLIDKERVDQPYVCMKMLGSIKEWHGFKWYRTCPECKHQKFLRSKEDEPVEEDDQDEQEDSVDIQMPITVHQLRDLLNQNTNIHEDAWIIFTQSDGSTVEITEAKMGEWEQEDALHLK